MVWIFNEKPYKEDARSDQFALPHHLEEIIMKLVVWRNKAVKAFALISKLKSRLSAVTK